MLPTCSPVLPTRDYVLRAVPGLLRTRCVPGHLPTSVLGPLQDNLLRPTGQGLELLKLTTPLPQSCPQNSRPAVWRPT